MSHWPDPAYGAGALSAFGHGVSAHTALCDSQAPGALEEERGLSLL